LNDIENNILEINNLSIGYILSKRNNRTLFSNINLNAKNGELIALVGSNGIGKSTLLKNIANLHEFLAGNIYISGKSIHSYSRRDFAKNISFVSTETVNTNNLTAKDIISLGRFPHTNWLGKLSQNDKKIINRSIELLGILELVQKNINELSDGERQKVMIARSLAQDTKIIILDEPTAFLDIPNKNEIVHILNELSKKENKTIIFSTHDLNIAIREADKIWLMTNNEILEDSPEDLILNNKFEKIFDNKKVFFDKKSGDFNKKRNYYQKVGLFGNDEVFVWTKKALERINYHVVCNKKQRINVRSSMNKWTFFNENEELDFSSIYDLTNFLTSKNNLYGQSI
jgi:iron complex transport system ATP-binding protein